jgi:hypothetical protein
LQHCGSEVHHPSGKAGDQLGGPLDLLAEAPAWQSASQIPWHKRSRELDTLRAYGLVGIERVPPRVNARMPEALDIAILTGEGQKELGRLERMELLRGWRRSGLLAYQTQPYIPGNGTVPVRLTHPTRIAYDQQAITTS